MQPGRPARRLSLEELYIRLQRDLPSGSEVRLIGIGTARYEVKESVKVVHVIVLNFEAPRCGSSSRDNSDLG